jgi:hypothetical protein
MTCACSCATHPAGGCACRCAVHRPSDDPLPTIDAIWLEQTQRERSRALTLQAAREAQQWPTCEGVDMMPIEDA